LLHIFLDTTTGTAGCGALVLAMPAKSCLPLQYDRPTGQTTGQWGDGVIWPVVQDLTKRHGGTKRNC